MLKQHFVSPYRMAVGGASLSALAANYNGISLYHNGSGQFALMVRDFSVANSASGIITGGYFQGPLGTLSAQSSPLVTGEAAMPGQIYTQQQTTPFAPVSRIYQTGVGLQVTWNHDLPYAVLLPGWSFFLATGAVNIGLAAQFTWEAVFVGNLQAPADHTEVTELIDEAIKRAERAIQ